MMETYSKLSSSLIHSTVWREPDHVRLVWITMLAIADRHGVVRASVPGLADAARVTIDLTIEALNRFSGPDQWSRSKTEEGRRIRDVQGGWELINHKLYRQLGVGDERRAQIRKAVQKHRLKVKSSNTRNTPDQIRSDQDQIREEDKDDQSPEDGGIDLMPAWALEVQAGSEPDTKRKYRKKKSDLSPGFMAFWEVYPRKVAKAAARKAWVKNRLEGNADRVIAAIQAQAPEFLTRPSEKIPHAATWINGERWEDEITPVRNGHSNGGGSIDKLVAAAQAHHPRG